MANTISPLIITIQLSMLSRCGKGEPDHDHDPSRARTAVGHRHRVGLHFETRGGPLTRVITSCLNALKRSIIQASSCSPAPTMTYETSYLEDSRHCAMTLGATPPETSTISRGSLHESDTSLSDRAHAESLSAGSILESVKLVAHLQAK